MRVNPDLALFRPFRAMNTNTRAVAPLECLGNRSSCCFEARGLRVTGLCGRTRQDSPVVEHDRKMRNATCAFARAQCEVVILGSFEADSESAHLFEQRAAHAERV